MIYITKRKKLMRLDKYLKLTRLIKRRTVAKDLLKRDIFTINRRIAKPSSSVNVGDEIVLVLGNRKVTFVVEKVVDYCKKEDSSLLYKIISEEIIDDAGN